MNMLGGMSRTITSFTLFSTSPGESRRWAEARSMVRVVAITMAAGTTLVRHVTHHEAEVAVVELQEVVEVAAHLASWLVVSRKLVAWQVGHMFGQEGLLDQARDPELLLDALAPEPVAAAGGRVGRPAAGAVWVARSLRSLRSSARVLLLGEARPQVEKPDQLALAHQRHDHLDVGAFMAFRAGESRSSLSISTTPEALAK